MKEKIEKLIQHHKEAKQECYGLCNDLSSMNSTSMSDEEKDALKTALIKAEFEYAMRGVFINQLEDIL